MPITHIKMECALTSTHATREMRFKQVSTLEWSVKTTTAEQSEKFMQIKHINGVKVIVEKNEDLNCIHGTVSVPPHMNIDISKDSSLILESLKRRDKRILDLEMYTIPNRRRTTQPILIAKLKFEGDTLPDKIAFLGEMREIREFVPRPLQCSKCNRFSHPAKYCKDVHKCAVCSGHHPTTWECKNEIKCSNCGGNHNARSKNCIHYTYHTQIKILQTRNALSYGQARYELKIQGFEDPRTKIPYSAVTRQNIPNTNENNAIKNGTSSSNKSILEKDLTLESKNQFGQEVGPTRWLGSAPSMNNSNEQDQFWETESIPKSLCIAENKQSQDTSLDLIGISTSNRFDHLTSEEEDTQDQSESDTTLDFEDVMTEKTSKSSPKSSSKKKRKMTQSPEGKLEAKINKQTDKATSKQENEKTPSTERTQTFVSNQEKQNITKFQIESGAQATRTSGERAHPNECGCHYCFVSGIKNMDKPTQATVMDFVRTFCKNKTQPTKHFTPLALCKCSAHMSRRLREPKWLQDTSREILLTHCTQTSSGNQGSTKNQPSAQKRAVINTKHKGKDGQQRYQ